jgi:DtxR family Mn-dependent transcriptional regulator
MLSEKAEEILETLWISFEEKKLQVVNLEKLRVKEDNLALRELVDNDLIIITVQSVVNLTPKGKKEGRDIVRRHRLAERLLVDVLDVKGELINETACQFEHLLHKGIDDSICTLLGHPKVCPHGNLIPEGKCCEGEIPNLQIISPLSKLPPGGKGKIAYIHAKDKNKLQKMMAMGVLPGVEISLLQSFPSFLFQIGNSQFAVDESIADEIFVRISKEV